MPEHATEHAPNPLADLASPADLDLRVAHARAVGGLAQASDLLVTEVERMLDLLCDLEPETIEVYRRRQLADAAATVRARLEDERVAFGRLLASSTSPAARVRA